MKYYILFFLSLTVATACNTKPEASNSDPLLEEQSLSEENTNEDLLGEDINELFKQSNFESNIRSDFTNWELSTTYTDTLIFKSSSNYTWQEAEFTNRTENYISMRSDLNTQNLPETDDLVLVWWSIKALEKHNSTELYFSEYLESIQVISDVEVSKVYFGQDSTNTMVFTYKSVNAYQELVDLIFEDENGKEHWFNVLNAPIEDPYNNDFYTTTKGELFLQYAESDRVGQRIRITYIHKMIHDAIVDEIVPKNIMVEYEWLDN